MIIRLKVFEQTLSIVDTKSVPRKGSKDYLLLQFAFSSDWKDLDKVCYLQKGDVSQPIEVVENFVEVPEWFTEQDSFDVTLFGTNSSQEVPTNVVALQLEKSNTLWEQDAPEPQPSWLAKIIDLNNHPPVPGDNGYWLLWDTDSGAYVESESPLPAVKESFVITFSASVSGDSITYSCDKTYADILAAYNDGRPLMALIPVGSSTEKVCTSTYRFVYGVMNMNRVDFYAEIRAKDLDVEQATLLCAFVIESGPARVIEIDMQPGIRTLGIVKGVPGLLTGYQYTSAEPNVDYMPPVPITAADNGKFLRVVNGAWAAATIENANGVSF